MSYYVGSVEQPAGREGWLIGAFLEKNHSCFSEAVEIAWKELGTDARDPKHIHKLAIEISVIIRGSLVETVDGQHLVLKSGNYIIVHPFTPVEVLGAEEGTIVLVIKASSLPGDKYLCQAN